MIRPSKILIILLLTAAAILAAAGADLPRAEGYIADFAGIINAGDRERLEGLLGDLRQKTGTQIAVVSVKTYAPHGSIEGYAEALFNHWGIGQKGRDNGVLLILAMEERDVRIETGYGLEGVLPDSFCGRILDQAVLPEFREGRYSRGLLEGARAIAAVVAKANNLDPASLGLTGKAGTRKSSAGEYNIALTFAIIALVFVILPLMFRRRRGFCPPRSFGSGSFGSGGVFRSGGGGGFGGGRSGGGGASRKF